MVKQQAERISSGLTGLDEILHGGLLTRRAYLVWGGAGSGKTTLGVQFLREAPVGHALLVSLGETAEQLRDNASRMGLSIDDMDILDLSPQGGGDSDTYELLESWEAEGSTIHDRIVEHCARTRPERVFIDSLSQLRYLTPDAFQFRRVVLSILRQLTAAGSTIVLTAERGAESGDDDLQFLCDAVIRLDLSETGRLCEVIKVRGSAFESGYHYYSVGLGGVNVYPRLNSSLHGRKHEHESISSGVDEIDRLVGGGIERGTVTILTGPTGVGKTLLGAHFVSAAARRGERAVLYSFDENADIFMQRCESTSLSLRPIIKNETLKLQAIEPLDYNPDQFAHEVRHEVEERGVRVVMIDSLAGFRHAVRADDLDERVHALCRYLSRMGVAVILVNEVDNLSSEGFKATEQGISYLADTIILLRYVQSGAELGKCIGVLKKRTGDFEKTFRPMRITSDGLQVDGPLPGIRGVLNGAPENTQAPAS